MESSDFDNPKPFLFVTINRGNIGGIISGFCGGEGKDVSSNSICDNGRGRRF